MKEFNDQVKKEFKKEWFAFFIPILYTLFYVTGTEFQKDIFFAGMCIMFYGSFYRILANSASSELKSDLINEYHELTKALLGLRKREKYEDNNSRK